MTKNEIPIIAKQALSEYLEESGSVSIVVMKHKGLPHLSRYSPVGKTEVIKWLLSKIQRVN